MSDNIERVENVLDIYCSWVSSFLSMKAGHTNCHEFVIMYHYHRYIYKTNYKRSYDIYIQFIFLYSLLFMCGLHITTLREDLTGNQKIMAE